MAGGVIIQRKFEIVVHLNDIVKRVLKSVMIDFCVASD